MLRALALSDVFCILPAFGFGLLIDSCRHWAVHSKGTRRQQVGSWVDPRRWDSLHHVITNDRWGSGFIPCTAKAHCSSLTSRLPSFMLLPLPSKPLLGYGYQTASTVLRHTVGSGTAWRIGTQPSAIPQRRLEAGL